jgi:hypothetical protein
LNPLLQSCCFPPEERRQIGLREDTLDGGGGRVRAGDVGAGSGRTRHGPGM